MSNDSGFHNKYRPDTLDRLIGNTRAVTQMKGYIASGKFPSAILFTGPPGAGKTTIARAFANDVLEGENVSENLQEWNFGADRSIEDIRGIIQTVRLRPGYGAKRRFLLGDEVHAVVSNKPAADALLKPLEEPVKTTTFLLCSMEPDKFSGSQSGRAILSRCIHISLTAPTRDELRKQAIRIMKGEDMRDYMSAEVIDKVLDSTVNSGSSFRVLANTLEALCGLANGLPEGQKLTVDDVPSSDSMIQNDDSATAVRFLVAVYNMKYVAAHREVLDMTDPVGFIKQLMWLNWFVQNQVILKEARHPKVWGSKSGFELWKQVKPLFSEENTPREIAVHRTALVTQALASLMSVAGAFAIDEKVLLSAKAFELINDMKKVK